MINERKLTDKELKQREQSILALKKNKRSLVKKYGKDAEKVMYGIATKQAKSKVEEMNKEKLRGMIEDALKNPKSADLNKDGKLSSYEKKRGAAIEKNLEENLNPEVTKTVSRFIKGMAKRYGYSEQDAVYAIVSAIRGAGFMGLEEDDREEDDREDDELSPEELANKYAGSPFFGLEERVDKVDALLEEERNEWPKELTSRYSDEYRFELQKVEPTYKNKPGRAKYHVIDIESGKLKGTPVFGSIESLEAFADDLIKPQGGTQSSHFGESLNETASDKKLDHEVKVKAVKILKDTLKKEGGAAGLKPLIDAVKDLGISKKELLKLLKKMVKVEKHTEGDYILTPINE